MREVTGGDLPARNQAARGAMRDLLAAVVREGTGRAARMEDAVAGNTGTSQEHKDAWFVGFTRDLVVGVWVGNDDSTPTRNVTGGDLPARIFKEFLAQSTAARAKLARAATPVAMATTGQGAPLRQEGSSIAIRGVPHIRNTGTIEIDGRPIRLFGVEGVASRAVRDFRHYVGRREVVCEPSGGGNTYRCQVGDQDLSRVVLYNGGGRATPDASAELKAAEQQARSQHAGIWAEGDDDD